MMSVWDILDVLTVSDTVNGEWVYWKVFTSTATTTNPCSVVVMDNCTVHHVPDIVEMIEDMVHFLPPYSPDLNTIELVFSKVKEKL